MMLLPLLTASHDDGQWRIARIVSYDHGPFQGLNE